jgi:glucuronoxylan 4-O-methyltransferase
MRRVNGIQLSAAELRAIALVVKRKAPCRFLIFGLGNDAAFWLRLNPGGATAFIEDNEDWLREGLRRNPGIALHLVAYETLRPQWRDLLDASPRSLSLRLPAPVARARWDVIVVDAPAGWGDATPGRMKSIFEASRLAAADADVFVHDCDREVERVYCDRFLKSDNLIAEVGLLRHYHFARAPVDPDAA